MVIGSWTASKPTSPLIAECPSTLFPLRTFTWNHPTMRVLHTLSVMPCGLCAPPAPHNISQDYQQHYIAVPVNSVLERGAIISYEPDGDNRAHCTIRLSRKKNGVKPNQDKISAATARDSVQKLFLEAR